MRFLISNDDGLFSEGLTELANILSPWCDVTVVVPAGPQSAASHAITLHRPVRLYKVDEVAPGVPTYIVTGSPTDSVVLALDFVMKSEPPDLVLSGINKGGNTAEDVSYSGTVAAAMEGALCRIPSVAISLEGAVRTHYHVAALAALGLMCRIARAMGKPFSEKAEEIVPSHLRLSDSAAHCDSIDSSSQRRGYEGFDFRHCSSWPFVLLNMNVPDLPESEIKGWQVTALGKRDYKDIVVPREDPRGTPYYWIAGEEVVVNDPPGSDIRAVRDGYISLTPILLDYTDRAKLTLLADSLGGNAQSVFKSVCGNENPIAHAADCGSLALEQDDLTADSTRFEAIPLRVGGLTGEQLDLVLRNVPADLTFNDENDRIVYYAEKDEYIFSRNEAIIGMDIRGCHSEKSLAELEEMLRLFKSGDASVAESWKRRDGRFIRTRYIAVRDDAGAYRGILEVTDDVTAASNRKNQSETLEWR